MYEIYLKNLQNDVIDSSQKFEKIKMNDETNIFF